MIVANKAAPAPAPSADAAPPAGGANAQSANAPDDFMDLLAQLVEAPVAGEVPAPAIVTADAAKDTDDDMDPADLASILPIALLPQQLDVPTDKPVQGDGSDAGIETLLGIAGKGNSTLQNAAQTLSTALAAAGDQDTKKAADSQTTAPTLAFAEALNAHHRSATDATDPSGQQQINSPVGSPQWRDEIGARINMMVQQGNHSASLRLSPEHLGPLEVRISVQNDQASVWFGAAHADTRAAIEHALPRLRELFASQGLSLADAGVFREPPREQPRQSFFSSSSRGDGSFEGTTVQSVMIRRLGLVDAYA